MVVIHPKKGFEEGKEIEKRASGFFLVSWKT